MPETAREAIADRLVGRLRVALLVVAAAILLLDLPTLIADADRYRPLWLEAAAYALLAVVTVRAASVVLSRRRWGGRRWPLLIGALVANTAATAAIAPADLFGTAHWSWDIFGWWAVLLLLDRKLRDVLLVMAVRIGVTAGQVLLAGRADRATLVGMGISALAMGGMPIAAWLAGAATNGAAALAAELAAGTERRRTREQIARQVHHDRRTRYADLSDTAAPLLAGLATGVADPADPGVRQACFLEAARIRRLFAEADDSEDPLLHELAACADTAGRRGVVVSLAARGQRPDLPAGVRRAMTDAALGALAAARSTARVTVITTEDRVTVTVVADARPHLSDETTTAGDGPVIVTRARHDEAVWTEASCQIPAAARSAPGGP